MPIDWSLFKYGKGQPRTLERHGKKVEKQIALDEAYVIVDKRDKKRCQVRGTPLTAGVADEWRALERDHLGPRSTHPEDRANPDNILTVSRGVHHLLQSGALIPVDAKGEETISVKAIVGYRWNRRMVKAGKEPFRLKRKAAA